jgi:hypothetical protein
MATRLHASRSLRSLVQNPLRSCSAMPMGQFNNIREPLSTRTCHDDTVLHRLRNRCFVPWPACDFTPTVAPSNDAESRRSYCNSIRQSTASIPQESTSSTMTASGFVPDHLIPKPPQLPRSKHTGRQCSAFTCTRIWRCSDQPRSLILLYVGGNDVGPSAGPHLNNRKPVSARARGGTFRPYD